jgi:hypothetical protein
MSTSAKKNGIGGKVGIFAGLTVLILVLSVSLSQAQSTGSAEKEKQGFISWNNVAVLVLCGAVIAFIAWVNSLSLAHLSFVIRSLRSKNSTKEKVVSETTIFEPKGYAKFVDTGIIIVLDDSQPVFLQLVDDVLETVIELRVQNNDYDGEPELACKFQHRAVINECGFGESFELCDLAQLVDSAKQSGKEEEAVHYVPDKWARPLYLLQAVDLRQETITIRLAAGVRVLKD